MCLDLVDGKTRVPKSDIGYKVFKERNGKLTPVYFHHGRIKAFEVGKPKRCNLKKKIGWRQKYIPGFHLFSTRKDAETYRDLIAGLHRPVVGKVRFTDVVASGVTFISFFNHLKVLVVKEVTILETY